MDQHSEIDSGHIGRNSIGNGISVVYKMRWLINIIDWAVTFETDYYKHQTGGLYCVYIAIVIYFLLGFVYSVSFCGLAFIVFITWEYYHKKTKNKPFSWTDIIAATLPVLALVSVLVKIHLL